MKTAHESLMAGDFPIGKQQGRSINSSIGQGSVLTLKGFVSPAERVRELHRKDGLNLNL